MTLVGGSEKRSCNILLMPCGQEINLVVVASELLQSWSQDVGNESLIHPAWRQQSTERVDTGRWLEKNCDIPSDVLIDQFALHHKFRIDTWIDKI